MNDLISRQAVIDAIENTDWYHVADGELVHDANSKEDEPLYKAKDIYGVIENLPSTQPEEAISVAWLEEQAKWFESMDNAFAKIEANNIRVMIKKWRRENGRFNQQTCGD